MVEGLVDWRWSLGCARFVPCRALKIRSSGLGTSKEKPSDLADREGVSRRDFFFGSFVVVESERFERWEDFVADAWDSSSTRTAAKGEGAARVRVDFGARNIRGMGAGASGSGTNTGARSFSVARLLLRVSFDGFGFSLLGLVTLVAGGAAADKGTTNGAEGTGERAGSVRL